MEVAMSDLSTKLAEALAFDEAELAKAIKTTEYKYFGDYEFDENQHKAVETLVKFARLAPLHKLLVELASAADRLGNCCAEFDDLHYCAEYFQALDDKVQALRTQLSKEGV